MTDVSSPSVSNADTERLTNSGRRTDRPARLIAHTEGRPAGPPMQVNHFIVQAKAVPLPPSWVPSPTRARPRTAPTTSPRGTKLREVKTHYSPVTRLTTPPNGCVDVRMTNGPATWCSRKVSAHGRDDGGRYHVERSVSPHLPAHSQASSAPGPTRHLRRTYAASFVDMPSPSPPALRSNLPSPPLSCFLPSPFSLPSPRFPSHRGARSPAQRLPVDQPRPRHGPRHPILQRLRGRALPKVDSTPVHQRSALRGNAYDA